MFPRLVRNKPKGFQSVLNQIGTDLTELTAPFNDPSEGTLVPKLKSFCATSLNAKNKTGNEAGCRAKKALKAPSGARKHDEVKVIPSICLLINLHSKSFRLS